MDCGGRLPLSKLGERWLQQLFEYALNKSFLLKLHS